MSITIRFYAVATSAALEKHVNKRLGFMLGRVSTRVRDVEVRLSDVGGWQGVNGKRCLIKVSLDGLEEVVVEDTESDFYTAIDRAAGRAGRTVLRRLTLAGLRHHPESTLGPRHGPLG